MKTLYRTIAVLALVGGLAACNGDSVSPTADDDPASFTATVSGDLTATMEGEAVFGEITDPDTSEDAWALWLAPDTNAGADFVTWLLRLGPRPDGGSYSLADASGAGLEPGDVGGYLSGANDGVTVSMVSTGGSLTITSSTQDRVQGTFTIQATGTIVTGSQSVQGTLTISGEFDAARGTVNFPL